MFPRSQEENELELLQAAQQGDLPTVLALLSSGVNVNTLTRDKEYKSPLRLAAENGHSDVVVALIKRSAHINPVDIEHSSPLRGAAYKGHISIVNMLLNVCAEIDAPSPDGYTALAYAAIYGHSELVRMLVDRGANYKLRNTIDQATPFIGAATYGMSDVLQYFISIGVNLEKKDKSGNTALLYAVINNHLDCVRILVLAGANINCTNIQNRTALGYAAKNKNIEMIKFLLDSRAILNNNQISLDSDDILKLFHLMFTELEEWKNSQTVVGWYQRICDNMQAKGKYDAADIAFLTKLAVMLFEYSHDRNLLTEFVKRLFLDVLYHDETFALDKINDPEFHNIINELDGKPVSYLHASMKIKNISNSLGYMMLVKDNKPDILYDEEGNSLLHLCGDESYYDTFCKLLPDINYQNHAGDTALLRAIKIIDQEKIMWLLQHGASIEIANNSRLKFCDIIKIAPGLFVPYLQFLNTGLVLFPPPVITDQSGPCCGFYAAHCAVNHIFVRQFGLFKKKVVPARKRDEYKKPANSLRQMAKLQGDTTVGEVLSADAEGRIIEAAGGKYKIIDIDNYSDFRLVIIHSLTRQFPVLLPFSSSKSMPKIPPTAEGAHWATIIGYHNHKEESLLIAQYGDYSTAPMQDYFTAFFDIPSDYPSYVCVKDKTQNTWKKSTDPLDIDKPDSRKVTVTNLDKFRRRLVVVLPQAESSTPVMTMGSGNN